jgi:hypothetical protein
VGSLIVVLVVVGVLLTVFHRTVEMDPRFKYAVEALAILAVFLYVAHGFGYGMDFSNHHWRS